LIENKFDFNKLFKEGVSYQRLCDKELVRDRIRKNIQTNSKGSRFYTHLGT
jgi:exonuclease VII small subunit